MLNEHLQSILGEYRPSMKCVVMVEKQTAWETTVAEVMIELMKERPEKLLAIFGRSSCIVRERGEDTDDVPGAAPYREWLEIDVR